METNQTVTVIVGSKLAPAYRPWNNDFSHVTITFNDMDEVREYALKLATDTRRDVRYRLVSEGADAWVYMTSGSTL